MYDCSKDIVAYHDDEATLPLSAQTKMRSHRDANRDRLKKGLKEAEKPTPLEFKSQGSYAMKTMVQHPEGDYDIDDGVYFNKSDLVSVRGAEMTSLQVRQMVRDALDDGSFKTAPEVRKNCVRVYYEAGYHVDVPSYRRITAKDINGKDVYFYELASSEWKRSDAREVTAWFEKQVSQKSTDSQLRRIVRLMKMHARSRASWSGQILSGFGITKLATDTFFADELREDRSLYYTMKAVRDRLKANLKVEHPVTPNETITNGDEDPKAQFLHDRLTEALDNLAPLFEEKCTYDGALKCWDKVFSTTYFSDRNKIEVKSALASLLRSATPAPAAPYIFPNSPRVDDKPRGFA
jgi:hypothetical protein